MKSNYRLLGDYIKQIKKKNTDGSVSVLKGIRINKEFMKSVANIQGTDLSKYRVVEKYQFAYNPMHVGRDEILPISVLLEDEPIIVSPAYVVFEILDYNILNPEYLMMWCRRSEFDRNVWFTTDSSVRGGFSWESLCELKLPIPSIEKQHEIVKEYNTVANRITLNETINKKLEDTAQALYKHWFVDFEFPNEQGKPYKSNGGKMVFNEELDLDIPLGWEVAGLSSIASYLNGTAMQKHPTDNIKKYTPVLKIRELNLGITDDNSDKASIDIPEKYKIYNGDIIFSWSGTLTIDIWSGGYAGLNQHLFKVFSNHFPKWYYYLSTKFYISEFIRIAEGNKTSMGHIKREHLDNSFVSYPIKGLNKLNLYFEPITQKIESNKIESQILKKIKNLLLSKMSKVAIEKETVC
ncbi:restriction endonuclease subunit S [Tenacibaculum finnmarkense]|uniref:restriction endonuclease subunit S n=1 Tax=Tenacibaculum finnmarkense TaxID=2781243 RepID=UPI00187B3972|nr:restriction endonuclease subunit S [Tenacibaculum finnmarkense]MBE7687443.1 restriction endonuclease subunit S [Tenacibaculum finnmarkense genomovar ulcerans]MCD8409678.1 restriction endonuclease subunit S [Tenacibaculum finnmarkense genomovar ulcerans]MCG8837967.1 restriction endonuclease subunit S [Tenacibaculum dicentrarchi]